jgi:hypothetical protein
MTKQEAIRRIEGLYPPDSDYTSTGRIGAALLEQAKRNVGSWRTEPEEVIFELLRLCEEKERENTRERL